MVEGLQRPGARAADRARVQPEPPAAGRRPADRGGPRPAGHRHRQAVSAAPGGVRQRHRRRPERERRQQSTFDRHFGDFQLGFDAAWELDFWGKFGRSGGASRPRRSGSVADYDDALVSLTAEVARTYAVIRTFEVLIEQARENAECRRKALRIAESRFRNGATSELDVTQATDAAREHPGVHPAAADQPAAGAQRAEHAAGAAAGHASRRCWRAPRRSPRRRRRWRSACRPSCCGGGPTSAAPSSLARRAVRPHRRRQGRLYPQLLAVRHGRARRRTSGGASSSTQPVRPRQPLLRRRPARRLAVLQLRPHQEQRARRGRAVSAAAGRLPEHRAQGGPGGGGRR